jgi:hypothetical protein
MSTDNNVNVAAEATVANAAANAAAQPAAPAAAVPPANVTPGKVLTPQPDGQVRASLFDIDIYRWPNYRKVVTEAHIEELARTLGMNKNGEQLQNIGGRWTEEGKIGATFGFCRVEAMTRNALQKLCDEYNETFGYAKGQPEYVNCRGKMFDNRSDRARIRDAGPAWAEKYDNALKAYKLDVNIKAHQEGENIDLEVSFDNLIDNVMREDPPIWDLAVRIDDLSTRFGLTGKEIAKRMGKKEAAISQIKAIFNLPNGLRAMFRAAKEAGEIDADTLAQMEVAVDALIRKCGMSKIYDSSIPMSHARKMAEALNNSNNPSKPGKKISVKEFVRLLKVLVNMDKAGLIDEKKQRVDFGVFETHIEEAIRASVPVIQVPTVPAAPAAATTDAAATPPVNTVNTGDIAAAQAAVNAAIQADAAAPSAPAAPAAPAAPVAPAAPSKEDQLKAANAMAEPLPAATAPATTSAAAPIAGLDSTTTDDIMSQMEKDMLAGGIPGIDSTDEISSGADDVDVAGGAAKAPPKTTDGASRIKAVDPSAQTVSLRPVPKIQGSVLKYLEIANNPENNGVSKMAERLAALAAATTTLETIGMEKEQKVIDAAYNEYIEGFNAWLAKAESLLNAKLTDAEKLELAGLAPPFAKVEIVLLGAV